MKHVLLNPERYRLPDYPFIEKSERGCSSAGVGTVDKGGREEDEYYLNNVRFFYQGNQCVFYFGNINNYSGNPVDGHTNLWFCVMDPKADVGTALKGVQFGFSSSSDDYKENPLYMTEAYHPIVGSDMLTFTMNDLLGYLPGQSDVHPFRLYAMRSTLFLIDWLKPIDKEINTGKISSDRYISSVGAHEISIIPYISKSFDPLVYNLYGSGDLFIYCDSYSYNCGCLDVNISRFEQS